MCTNLGKEHLHRVGRQVLHLVLLVWRRGRRVLSLALGLTVPGIVLLLDRRGSIVVGVPVKRLSITK